MKSVFVLSFLFLVVSQIAADDKLECYQCSPVTEPCEVGTASASTIQCGTVTTSKCQTRVKHGASDLTKAKRLCVVPDKQGKVACEIGYRCNECNTNLCNAGSTVNLTWIAFVGMLCSILYLH